MIKLNDYLYAGDTVLRILQKYSADLKDDAEKTCNVLDATHAEFLHRLLSLLENNDFLTNQSQRIREYYYYMVKEYPTLAFTFRGRIKSLIRAEEKFNGYILEYVYDYYLQNGTYPPVEELQERVRHFRDLIAYRIVISVPKCSVPQGANREEFELHYLYKIASSLPDFLAVRGFTPEPSGLKSIQPSSLLAEGARPYYRDYITNRKDIGYRSLHIALFDTVAHCDIELQLRTKEMDDFAEIGNANHSQYELRQQEERARRDVIPAGECLYFDEAYERVMSLQQLDLSTLDVNFFGAVNNHLINDGCGLYRGRQILPFEHLSRFQNEHIPETSR